MIVFDRKEKEIKVPEGLGNINLTVVDANLEDKTVEINEVETTILPSSGYNGMSSLQIDAQPVYDNGYNEGENIGYNSGYTAGDADGYNRGYNEGETDQKAKLTNITITNNGTYTKEDGYNEVIVDITPEPVITFPLDVTLTENGTYNYDPTEYGDGYSSVKVIVDVPDLNGDYNEGYDAGKVDGYNSGYTIGKEEGLDEGYQEGLENGYQNGFDNGIIEQKKLLTNITITENGTYTREDGYNSVVVNVEDTNGSYDEGYQAGKTDGYDEGYDVGKTDGYEEGQQNCPVPEMYSKTATTTGAYETFYPEDGKVGFSDVTVNSIPLINQYMTEFQNNGGSINITENGRIDTTTYIRAYFGFSFINNSYFNTGVLINKDTYWYIDFYATDETLKQTGTIFGGGGFALEIGNGLIWARYGNIISEKKLLIPNTKSSFTNSSFSFTTSLDSFVNTNDTIFIGGYNSGDGGMTNKTEVNFNTIVIGSDRFYFVNNSTDYNIYKNGTANYIGEDYLEYIYISNKGFPFNVDYINVEVPVDLSKYKYQQFTVYSKYDLDDTYIDISNYFNIFSIDSVYMYFSNFARLKTKIDDETYRYDFWTEEEIGNIQLNSDGDECLKQLVFKNMSNVNINNVSLNGLKEIDYFNVQNISLYAVSAPLQKIVYKCDFANLNEPYIDCWGNSFDDEVYIYGENDDNYVGTFESIEGSTLVRNNLIINV